MFKFSRFVAAAALTLSCAHSKAVDMAVVEKALTGKGVEGWVHGAANANGIYAFTYRTPGNFFDFVIMSLTTENVRVRAQLEGLGRHDKVRVQGKFLENPSPQKHIDIASLEVVEKFKPEYEMGSYDYAAKIPEELLKQSTARFLVHAIGAEGKILVVEYKDVVIPIFVKTPELTKNLYRNDVIELTYSLQREPDRPPHLKLKGEKPIKVLESIKEIHGKPGAITGRLIMFPKSPEIKFHVFAIQQELDGGLKRQFTIVNFDSPEIGKDKILFDSLTPLYPVDKLNLETKDRCIETRIIDMLCPFGKG
ncbi:MAG: hypothetical protein ABL958_17220, partial [Bdellovibrionia bacterium]